MNIIEKEAKTILRKSRRIDSWFISGYGMNLYRGCPHDCVYCDGRAETYRVAGEFGSDIEVKTNAVAVLERELDPARKRRPLVPCYLLLGGGVGDSYNPLERKYSLARSVLGIFARVGHPVHALTKSTLIERDIDLFEEINRRAGAIVSMSFSSVDTRLSALLEPGVPPPSKRLATLAAFKSRGIPTGMFLMPVVPCVTDTRAYIDDAVKAARDMGIDFVVFGSMTLKPGRQSDHFHEELRVRGFDLEPAYRTIYGDSTYGGAFPSYVDEIHRMFFDIAARYEIPVRVPRRLFERILSPRERTIVMLEHIDYMHRLAGKKTSYGYCAYLIFKTGIPETSSESPPDLFRVAESISDASGWTARSVDASSFESTIIGPAACGEFVSISKKVRTDAVEIYRAGTCDEYEQSMKFEV
jgi:DNA repair photolyase